MKKILFLLLSLVSFLHLEAQGSKPVNMRPIHEAFVQRIMNPVPIEVVTKQPPAAINETPPAQPSPKMVWVPGYWDWIREKQDFTWICGVWRLPPPGLTWLPGYWKEEKSGWVYIRGAWMPDATKSPWVYSPKAPASSQNEDTGPIPAAGDSFWSPGYWKYSSATTQFSWLSGSWQKFNPNFILEPAHWIWRPEGYLFVPSFWDWKLETRGNAYDCNTKAVLKPSEVAVSLTCCYPNYAPTCCYYWHYTPQYWDGCDCIPIWWGWQDWWSLPWGDSWWLWWWYINDGFPFPPFLPIDFIDFFPIPPVIIIDLFGGLPPPIFIIPLGVPSIDQWIDAINQELGGNNPPFLPPNTYINIIDLIDKTMPKPGKDRPHGNPHGGKDHKKPTGPLLTPPSGVAEIPTTPHTGDTTPPTDTTAPVPTPPTYTPPIITQPPEYVPIDSFTPVPQRYPEPQYYPQPQYEPIPERGWNGGWGGWEGGRGGWNGGHDGGGHRGGHDGGGHRGGHDGGRGGHDGGGRGGHDGGGKGHDGGGHRGSDTGGRRGGHK